MKISFAKKERILSKKTANTIYQSGNRLNGNYLNCFWREESIKTDIPIKLLISVPKKKIKKAVDRNYIKRLVRESYRLNKKMVYNSMIKSIEIILIYNHHNLIDFKTLNSELLTLFNLIRKKTNENTS